MGMFVACVWAFPALGDDRADSAETVQAKFQGTYVWQAKPSFPATHSGTNSLAPEGEYRSFSITATAFLGLRPWPGGEVYLNPEVSMSRALSDLHGLGGLPNGENQKGSSTAPSYYLGRLFLRQTWGLGGGTEQVESAPNQMAGSVDRQRLVLTAGKLSLLDVFDGNAYAHDPRTQFLNWALMAPGAWDFAADARGYTNGAALEYYRDEWALRAGRFEQPSESNGLPLDANLGAHYGDQIELEHGHEWFGQPGKLRLLAFRNRAVMGGFRDAIDYWNAHGQAGAPDVGEVRRLQSKTGYGLSLEQALTKDVGVFARYSRNDGGTETYAFAEIERSLSGGVVVTGTSWGRPRDDIGLALAQNGLSTAHQAYLADGGLGAFIGDGGIAYRPERIFEGYYSLAAARDVVLSLDYQHVTHPAYNAGRGPVQFLGLRLHVER